MAVSRPTVVLIHGLAAQRWMMSLLAYRIRQAGFQTVSFGYPSVWRSIETHAQSFARRLQRVEDDANCGEFHIVAHSLGSIVTRQVLLKHSYPKLHRIVMLAPPNHGSPAARNLGNYILPRCRPLRQLSDDPGSFVRSLPEPAGLEIGIVAADRDRVVSDASSRLSVQSDHLTVRSGHNGLLIRHAAKEATIQFLKEGKFSDS